MPRIIKLITAFHVIAAVLAAAIFFHLQQGIYLTLAITFGTTAYHFGMRLLVGLLYDRGMKNRADYTKKWYRIHGWEKSLYDFLKVKSWKGKLPTYRPENFSPKERRWEEIAEAMCQAELVHEMGAALSFLPLIASIWFGAFYVFLITSICGAVLDLLFVAVQRYNRSRMIKIVLRQR